MTTSKNVPTFPARVRYAKATPRQARIEEAAGKLHDDLDKREAPYDGEARAAFYALKAAAKRFYFAAIETRMREISK